MAGPRTVWVLLTCGLAGAVPALDLAPTTRVTVVLPPGAAAAEQIAAREVATYLRLATGAVLAVQTEAAAAPAAATGGCIFVGPTLAAARLGLDPARLAPEAWVVRTAGPDLYLLGGSPRGTLYAVYHFLEDVVGVHWWNPWEESVPTRPRLTLPALDLHGTPAFRYRDIYMLYGHDGGRFAARSRLNRQGDAEIEAANGGALTYGPPYHVHTAFMYFPPQQYFAQHPEWYSLLDGKRSGEGAQLCWTNPGLRAALRDKLLGYIASSWAAAKAAGQPPPLVFSISQNDQANPCQCGACQAITKAEGTEAAPLLDCVNAMADAVKERYPEVFLDTLAYQYTQQAPRTLRPRDNVIIRLCDTEADMLQPITAPANQAFRTHLLAWAALARNLRVWDYAITYGQAGMPLPTTHTFGPDYRFYAAHHVEGVFTELEDEILADWRDLKVWLMAKLLEDPAADEARLTETFLRGYYGAAGEALGQYLHALETEATARGTRCTCWQGAPLQLGYLNLDFVTRAQRLFDTAEQAVAPDPVLTRRVRYARLPLDRATLATWSRLAFERRQRGGEAAELPFERQAVARRALETWQAQIELRLLPEQREAARQAAEGEIRRYALVPGTLGVPAQFRDRPPGSVYDYTATMTRNWANVVKVVKDPEAESGVTNRLDLTAADVEHPERYVLPMPWGLYNTVDKQTHTGQTVQAEDIPGPGYHWFKLGSYAITPGTYLYFFWSWIIQVDVDNVFDPAAPGQQYECWARVKFEGPRFPHPRAGEQDAICVERVVLVKP